MSFVCSHLPHQGWLLQGPDRIHIRVSHSSQREHLNPCHGVPHLSMRPLTCYWHLERLLAGKDRSPHLHLSHER